MPAIASVATFVQFKLYYTDQKKTWPTFLVAMYKEATDTFLTCNQVSFYFTVLKKSSDFRYT